MAYHIAISTSKGGQAKTTTALNLADQLQLMKKRVLLVDTDPQCNSTTMYGATYKNVCTLYDIFTSNMTAEDCIQHTECGDILPCDIAMIGIESKIKNSSNMYIILKKALAGIEDEYDYVIYDTPPGYSTIQGNVFCLVDGVVVPLTCDEGGVEGLLTFYKMLNEFKKINPKLKLLGLLRVRYREKTKITRDIDDNFLPDAAKAFNTKIYERGIRDCINVQEAQSMHKRLSSYKKYCNAGLDYSAFAKELIGDIEK